MRSTSSVRATAAALAILLGMASCSSDDMPAPSTEPNPETTDRTGEEDVAGDPAASLATLDGTWSVAIGEPRVEATTGLLQTATVTAAVDGNQISVAWEGTLPSGAPHNGTKSHPLLLTGEVEMDCNDASCELSANGMMPFPAIMDVDGQLTIASMATNEPPTTACFDSPDGAWEVTVVDDSTLEILGAVGGGSSGDDGCDDGHLVVYTMTLTRVS